MKKSGEASQTCRDVYVKMAEPLINIVTKTLIVQDALKKPERDKTQKPAIKKNKADKNKPDKNNPEHIIDTYA